MLLVYTNCLFIFIGLIILLLLIQTVYPGQKIKATIDTTSPTSSIIAGEQINIAITLNLSSFINATPH